MAWKVKTLMSQRKEFVAFAQQKDVNMSELCRRFGVSRKTGYKWLARARAGESMSDRSRRPRSTPTKTDESIEALVLSVRQKHPAWGGRKIKRRLEDMGHPHVPATSTIHQLLLRNGLIDPRQTPKPHQRFERQRPNELWQMDFKGHFATDTGRCHPLTVLDDHSRFNLVLKACVDERLETVKAALIEAMRLYGMPESVLCDNGPPWGDAGSGEAWTRLGVWFLRRGIGILHGRAYHPQTQGKEERFHRTLNAEAIGTRRFRDPPECQRAFDGYRHVYNFERPHEALGMSTPGTRYTPSSRAYVETPPPVEYGPGDQVRRVCGKGCISFGGQLYRIGRAFTGEPVAVRPTTTDGLLDVFYCHQQVAQVNLRGESENG